MKLYEVGKPAIRKYGSAKKAIAAGEYILRDLDGDFIRSAFNFGHGTKKDMNRYMRDNAVFCVWIDASTMQPVKSI